VLQPLHFTTSELALFFLLLIFSFLAASGFWRMVLSLTYIYFFPFVLVWYAFRWCIRIIRALNRWIVAQAPRKAADARVLGSSNAVLATQVQSPTTGKKPQKPGELLRFLSRPFRSFTVLWGILLLVTTHMAVVWLCLVILLLQLGQKIFLLGKVLLSLESWLQKYGPLGFAGLNKTLEALDAFTPGSTPKNKELESLANQLSLWRKILDFLQDPYLMSRWAIVLGVAIFVSINAYFAFLFSFAYYGIAHVTGVSFSWSNALVISMFMPFFATDLPRGVAIHILGGIQCVLVLAIGVGTVMNFLRRKLDSVRQTATTYHERLADDKTMEKYLILQQAISARGAVGVISTEQSPNPLGEPEPREGGDWVAEQQLAVMRIHRRCFHRNSLICFPRMTSICRQMGIRNK
jgi:hypothetical protein